MWDPRQPDAPVAALEPKPGEVARDCWAVAFGDAHTADDRVLTAGCDSAATAGARGARRALPASPPLPPLTPIPLLHPGPAGPTNPAPLPAVTTTAT